MNIYIEIEGGVCQTVYYTGKIDSNVWVTIIDYDNDPSNHISLPLSERTILY